MRGSKIQKYTDQSGKASGMVISDRIVQFSDNSLKEKDITTPEWVPSKTELDKIEAIELLISKIDKNSLN